MQIFVVVKIKCSSYLLIVWRTAKCTYLFYLNTLFWQQVKQQRLKSLQLVKNDNNC